MELRYRWDYVTKDHDKLPTNSSWLSKTFESHFSNHHVFFDFDVNFFRRRDVRDEHTAWIFCPTKLEKALWESCRMTRSRLNKYLYHSTRSYLIIIRICSKLILIRLPWSVSYRKICISWCCAPRDIFIVFLHIMKWRFSGVPAFFEDVFVCKSFFEEFINSTRRALFEIR